MPSIRQEIRRLSQSAATFSCAVTIESITPVSDSFLRVAVIGDQLRDYREPRPADAFKILIPARPGDPIEFPQRDEDRLPHWPNRPGRPERPTLRAYTVRHFAPARRRLEFDVLRTHGFTAGWLGESTAGRTIGLSGMRRDFATGDQIDRHLIIGDASALPGIASIVESLAPGVAATVYLAVDHRSDKDLFPSRDDVTVHWVSGAGSPSGAGTTLEAAVRGSETRTTERTQVWIAAEAAVVRQLRRFALTELAVDRDDLQASAYWKAGVDSTQADVVHLRRYEDEVRAGADATDPDVRERIELEL